MNASLDRHLAAEVWEEYALGMRSEEDCKPLEEHLLICSDCQDVLAEADDYIRVMKAAMAQATPRDTGGKPVTGVGTVTGADTHASVSKPAKASAAVAGGLLFVWVP